MIVDVNAGTNVAEESAITGKSRNSGIIDPTKCAIVSTEPVLDSEVLARVKAADVPYIITT